MALLSTDSPGHPPVTAADLAAANGHSGLAAFLGESLLSELLANLKIENRRLDGASRWVFSNPPAMVPMHMPRASFGCPEPAASSHRACLAENLSPP